MDTLEFYLSGFTKENRQETLKKIWDKIIPNPSENQKDVEISSEWLKDLSIELLTIDKHINVKVIWPSIFGTETSYSLGTVPSKIVSIVDESLQKNRIKSCLINKITTAPLENLSEQTINVSLLLSLKSKPGRKKKESVPPHDDIDFEDLPEEAIEMLNENEEDKPKLVTGRAIELTEEILKKMASVLSCSTPIIIGDKEYRVVLRIEETPIVSS